MKTCKGCGKKITWGVTTDGKRIPLDPVPAIYVVTEKVPEEGFKELPDTVRVRRVQNKHAAMVTHFATCPDANKFSGSQKNE